MRRLESRLINQAFQISGVYPLTDGRLLHKLHNYILTLLLIILIGGIAVQTLLSDEGIQSRLLPLTYTLCCGHALTKRWTLFHNIAAIKQFLHMLDNAFQYSDEQTMINPRWSDAKLSLIHRSVTYMLLMLFFVSYASPFSSVFLGRSLNYSVIMYPIFVPWSVDTFPMYLVTWFLQALLVLPALMGIYSSTIFIVFTMIEFQREFEKICQAVRILELRTLDQLMIVVPKGDSEKEISDAAVAPQTMHNRKTIPDYTKTYLKLFRECVMHYQQIKQKFDIFSKWYNIFFTVELIESTSTICFLFFCALKLNDLSLFLNLLALCTHFVASLFFRCYTGEFFRHMSQKLETTLYDITWYEQPKSICKSLYIFQSQIRRQLILYGFDHFPASYSTFSAVSRISYSYCNFLLKS